LCSTPLKNFPLSENTKTFSIDSFVNSPFEEDVTPALSILKMFKDRAGDKIFKEFFIDLSNSS